MALVSGQEFCSFEELAESVKKWEKNNFRDLVHQELTEY